MSFKQAREYLTRVLPPPGEGAYITVAYAFMPKEGIGNRTKLPWAHLAYKTVEETIKGIARILKRDDTRDVWVCMTTQREAQAIDKNGFKYLKGIRLAEFAVAVKSLWLDIDCKEGEAGYPSFEAAIDALTKFLDDAKMVRPTLLVKSGSGLHVYWTMDRALTPEAWYPLACSLIEATKRHGLKCDAEVTADAARVLRPPNTFNHKTGTPRPVEMLGASSKKDYSPEELETALAPYKVVATFMANDTAYACVENPALFPRRAPLAGQSDLSAGIETAMPREQLRKCLDVIPNNKTDWNFWNTVGMRVFAATDGADYGLEEWQRWSDTNKTVANATDNCKDRWNTLHTSPPVRTGAGALVNQAREVLGDPNWLPSPPGVTLQPGQGLGPIPAIAPPVTDLPRNYVRNQDGTVWLLKQGDEEDGDNKVVPVCSYPMMDGRVQKNPWIIHFKTSTEKDVTEEISVHNEILGTADMRRKLQEQGFMVHDVKRLGDFLMSWTQVLAQTKGAAESRPFGWSEKNSKIAGFVYGGQLFSKAGQEPAQDPDPVLQKTYRPRGEMKPWMDASNFLARLKKPELDIILAASFAAPLVRFTGHRGLLLSVWSVDSGCGKSTALEIGQSVWGHATKGKSMLDDKQLHIMNKAGKLQSLPIYWDEIRGQNDANQFCVTQFRLHEGVERNRMKADITMRESGDWQTLMVSAANVSILEAIVKHTSGTDAGLYRCFQYEILKTERTNPEGVTQVTRMKDELCRNYGHAGLVYAKFLGENHETIDKEVAHLAKTLEKELTITQAERYWVAIIAVLLLGAAYANKLGLTKIDTQAMRKFLIQKFHGMRDEKVVNNVDIRDKKNLASILQEFFTAMHRHTLRTNRIHTSVGKPPKGAIKPLGDHSKSDGFYVQHGIEDGQIRISLPALRKWLDDQGTKGNNFIKMLKDEFKGHVVWGVLGSGTDYANFRATENLLHIKIKGTALEPLFEVQ